MVWEKDQRLARGVVDKTPILWPASHSEKVAATQDEMFHREPPNITEKNKKPISRTKTAFSLSSQGDSILASSDDEPDDLKSNSFNNIENGLFFRRLFKNITLSGQNKNTFFNNFKGLCSKKSKELCSVQKIFKNSTWQTWKNNNHLFAELGHSNLAEYSRHDMVQLIDECTENPSINNLIFFYNKNRSDVKNLNQVFRVMEFDLVNNCENLDKKLNENSRIFDFELSSENFYWVYDARDVQSSEIEVFSEDDEDDLFF